MSLEKETKNTQERPQFTVDIVPQVGFYVLRNGKNDPTKHGSKYLRPEDISPSVLGLSDAYYFGDYTFPAFYRAGWDENHKLRVHIGHTSSSVDIIWDSGNPRVEGIEKYWLPGDCYNWKTYHQGESVDYLNTDPWGAKIDRKLFTQLDEFGQDLDDICRGKLVMVNFQPGKGESVQMIYHFNIHGEQRPRGMHLLTHRVVKYPGKVCCTHIQRNVAKLGEVEYVDTIKYGRYALSKRITVEQMMQNIFATTTIYKKNKEYPNKHEFTPYANYWGVQEV